MSRVLSALLIIIKPFFASWFLVFMLLFAMQMNVNAMQSNDDDFIIVLDPGHGGHDPGNLGNGYLEKNIALNIVLQVGSILENTPGFKVIYTRNDDTFVDLYVRGEIANKANADLFVSVHCDSHTSDAYGAGTFVLGLHANKQNFEIAKKENSVIYLEDNYETRYADYDINSPESVIGLTIMQEEFLDQSIALAKTIQNNFSKKLKRKDREVKQAGFIVLHQTFMPSVLVETGFLTNDKEGAYLNSRNGQMEMGTSIAEAIINYRKGVQPDFSIVASPNTTPTATTNSVPAETKSEIFDPYAIAKEKAAEKEVLSEVKQAEIENKTTPETNQIPNKTSEIVQKPSEVKDVIATPIEDSPIEQEVVVMSEPTVVPEVVKETKTPVEVQTEVVEKVVEQEAAVAPQVIFKVQLMASKKEIPLEASNFGGLDKLSKESYKQFIRYMHGQTTTYKEAQRLKWAADAKGYPSSYIVAYQNGVRIPTPDAIKLVPE